MIPKLIFRVVPKDVNPVFDAYWARWQMLHPHWELREYRDPIDPADFPLTGYRFDGCYSGRQLADHVRLEALFKHGGVYVDSDVCPMRSIQPLLHLGCFIGREDDEWCCNAVLGAEPEHPAVAAMIERMLSFSIDFPEEMGTRSVSAVASARSDVSMLARTVLFPYRASDRELHTDWPVPEEYPEAFTVHRWARE